MTWLSSSRSYLWARATYGHVCTLLDARVHSRSRPQSRNAGRRAPVTSRCEECQPSEPRFRDPGLPVLVPRLRPHDLSDAVAPSNMRRRYDMYALGTTPSASTRQAVLPENNLSCGTVRDHRWPGMRATFHLDEMAHGGRISLLVVRAGRSRVRSVYDATSTGRFCCRRFPSDHSEVRESLGRHRQYARCIQSIGKTKR
jgi:DNA-directed RNA polymerase subunit N (RpoN/RPB10)